MNCDRLKNKVIIVTGGAGFIGSHLCDSIIENYPEHLFILDDFSLGKESNIRSLKDLDNVTVLKIDASNYLEMSRFFENKSIDVSFNLAVVPLPASLSEPKRTIDINILIASTLGELLHKSMYDTLIHVSSSEAYGTSVYDHKPMDESHPTFPTTPYAASKLACDHILLSYHRTFGLDIAIARPFNAYGPRQNEGSYAGVIPLTLSRIFRNEPPVIHGDGLQTRDYTYVKDIADAIPRLYEVCSTRGKVINLASGKEVTIKELIYKMMKLTGYSESIIYTPERQGDVRRHLGDISLAEKILDYQPKTDFQEGLERTIDWYRMNRVSR
jgi:UDP-glucose 4-epimerase